MSHRSIAEISIRHLFCWPLHSYQYAKIGHHSHCDIIHSSVYTQPRSNRSEMYIVPSTCDGLIVVAPSTSKLSHGCTSRRPIRSACDTRFQNFTRHVCWWPPRCAGHRIEVLQADLRSMRPIRIASRRKCSPITTTTSTSGCETTIHTSHWCMLKSESATTRSCLIASILQPSSVNHGKADEFNLWTLVENCRSGRRRSTLASWTMQYREYNETSRF